MLASAIAAVTVGGGAAIAVAQQDPSPPDLDRAAQVAQDAAGGGEVVGVEQDDDGSYEVYVRQADGTETEVDLSASFEVIRTAADADTDDDGSDTDDLPIDEATRSRAGDAALASVDEGTVVSVEAEADGYDVEIRHADGTESEVHLDSNMAVVSTEQDTD